MEWWGGFAFPRSDCLIFFKGDRKMNHTNKWGLSKYVDEKVIVFVVLLTCKTLLFHHFTNIHINRTNFLTTMGFFIVVFSIAGFLKGRKKLLYLYLFNLIFTLLFFINTLYFSYFGAPITSFTFLQVSNLQGLGESIFTTLKVNYILFFADLILIPLYFRLPYQLSKKNKHQIGSRYFLIYIIFGFIFTFYYPVRMYSFNEQIFKPRFDSVDLIRNFGLFGYQTIDTYTFIHDRKTHTLSDKEGNIINGWFKNDDAGNIAVSFNKKPVHFIGKISYSLYLFHIPILLA
jgi:hypothetical protein